jgi:hypothetical protein
VTAIEHLKERAKTAHEPANQPTMRLSIYQPAAMGSLTPAMSTNTSNTQSTADNSAYLDPHTTVAEGYQPRPARWRLALTKLQTSLAKPSLHRRSKSLNASDASSLEEYKKQEEEVKQREEYKRREKELASRHVANLTERNLTEFFNPDYSNELDVFKDPRTRENPFDNPRKRERVGSWLEELP